MPKTFNAYSLTSNGNLLVFSISNWYVKLKKNIFGVCIGFIACIQILNYSAHVFFLWITIFRIFRVLFLRTSSLSIVKHGSNPDNQLYSRRKILQTKQLHNWWTLHPKICMYMAHVYKQIHYFVNGGIFNRNAMWFSFKTKTILKFSRALKLCVWTLLTNLRLFKI